MQVASAQLRAKLVFFMLAALSCLLLSPAARAQTPPQGWWLDQTGRAGILIEACGSELCGRIEWLKIPLDPQGKPKTDIHNAAAVLRSRPLCGLPMLGGFVPDGDARWAGGWVYDPEVGKTYRSVMHIAADGSLRVRGYIGVPLLGRSTVWTRLPTPPPQCKAAP